MKVLIKNEKGDNVAIDAETVLVNGKSLASIVSDVRVLTESFNRFKAKQEQREEELHKLWGRIKNVKS